MQRYAIHPDTLKILNELISRILFDRGIYIPFDFRVGDWPNIMIILDYQICFRIILTVSLCQFYPFMIFPYSRKEDRRGKANVW